MANLSLAPEPPELLIVKNVYSFYEILHLKIINDSKNIENA